MAFLQVGANPRTRFVMNSTWKRQLDAPEWAVMRCDGKAGQRCGLLLDKVKPEYVKTGRAAVKTPILRPCGPKNMNENATKPNEIRVNKLLYL